MISIIDMHGVTVHAYQLSISRGKFVKKWVYRPQILLYHDAIQDGLCLRSTLPFIGQRSVPICSQKVAQDTTWIQLTIITYLSRSGAYDAALLYSGLADGQ